MSPLCHSRILKSQNYSQVSISRKDNPTLETWKFAARYSFLELEAYCRSSSPFIAAQLKAILGDSTRGLVALSRHGISLDVLNQVTIDLVTRTIDNPRPGRCIKPGCHRYCNGDVCRNCKTDGWNQIRKD